MSMEKATLYRAFPAVTFFLTHLSSLLRALAGFQQWRSHQHLLFHHGETVDSPSGSLSGEHHWTKSYGQTHKQDRPGHGCSLEGIRKTVQWDKLHETGLKGLKFLMSKSTHKSKNLFKYNSLSTVWSLKMKTLLGKAIPFFKEKSTYELFKKKKFAFT